MEMNKRVNELRKALGLTLEKFAEPLGVKKAAISKIENAQVSLTEQMANSICLVYGVSEEWLKTGKGQMLVDRPLADELKEKIDSFIPKEEEDFRLRLVRMILAMDRQDMGKLEQYARKYLLDVPDQEETTAAGSDVPDTNDGNMTRDELHSELDRQLDTVKEGKSTAG